LRPHAISIRQDCPLLHATYSTPVSSRVLINAGAIAAAQAETVRLVNGREAPGELRQRTFERSNTLGMPALLEM